MATFVNTTCDVFKRFGGNGRAIDGRNIYFLFSYFLPKHEWLWFIFIQEQPVSPEMKEEETET